MKKNIINLGFTLVEIISVVAIIGIISIGISRLNFNYLGDKQRLDIYSNQIISRYETIRNNSLIGRGIGDGTNIDRISDWKLEFSLKNSGSLIAKYSTGAGIFNNSREFSLEADSKKIFGIKSMKCLTLSGTLNQTLNLASTGTILFKGDNISLSGCTDLSSKILELDLFYKSHEKNLRFNTVNGLVEES